MNNRPLKTYVFYCSHHLEANQFVSLCRGLEGDTVKTIGLPCSGKVDVPYLIKAFETGADGVALVTCPKDECRHFEGSARAHKRAEAVESLLEEIGLPAGRIAVFECRKTDTAKVIGELKQFIGRARNQPPTPTSRNVVNPLKSVVA